MADCSQYGAGGGGCEIEEGRGDDGQGFERGGDVVMGDICVCGGA